MTSLRYALTVLKISGRNQIFCLVLELRGKAVLFFFTGVIFFAVTSSIPLWMSTMSCFSALSSTIVAASMVLILPAGAETVSLFPASFALSLPVDFTFAN